MPTDESSNTIASDGRMFSLSKIVLYISGFGLPCFTSSPASIKEKASAPSIKFNAFSKLSFLAVEATAVKPPDCLNVFNKFKREWFTTSLSKYKG